MGEQQVAVLRLHPVVVLRRAGQIVLAAMDKVFGVLLDPGVIESRVVRDKVEHQFQSALVQPLSQTGQRRVAAESAMARCSR